MRYKFLFTIFVSFFITLFLALGFWQLYRLNWKLNLISEIEYSLKNDPVELSKTNKKSSPKVIIAHTVKGKGVSFMESVTKWHHAVPTEKEVQIAMEIEKGDVEVLSALAKWKIFLIDLSDNIFFKTGALYSFLSS